MPSALITTDGYLSAGGTDLSTIAKIHKVTVNLNIETVDITGWADLAHKQVKALGAHSWSAELTLNGASPWDDLDTLLAFVASATTTAIVVQPAADGGGTAAANNPTFSFNYQWTTVGDIGAAVGERGLNLTIGGDIDGQVTIAWGGSPSDRTI